MSGSRGGGSRQGLGLMSGPRHSGADGLRSNHSPCEPTDGIKTEERPRPSPLSKTRRLGLSRVSLDEPVTGIEELKIVGNGRIARIELVGFEEFQSRFLQIAAQHH